MGMLLFKSLCVQGWETMVEQKKVEVKAG